jgi:diguanylate cyclase (GGDEF)-like protein
VNIPNPFWRTLQFRLLAAALALSIVGLWFLYRRQSFRAAFVDPVTGLVNRRRFNSRLESLLFLAHQSGPGLTVIYFSLDRFHMVTGSLGSEAANQLLATVVSRVQGTIHKPEVLARLGNSLFGLIVPDLIEEDRAVQRARALQNRFAQPISVEGHDVFIDISVGVVIGPGDYGWASEMMRDAETAHDRARGAEHESIVLFDASMRDVIRDHLRRQSEFRRALERGELRVCYQPICELASGRVMALEAMVRWQHPARGLLTPDQFLDVAEETGLIGEMDCHVVETACAQLVQWRQDGLFGDQTPSLHANLSPRHFSSPDVGRRVSDIAQRYGLCDGSLVIEITEHHMLDRSETTMNEIQRLRDQGIGFGIDDFGAGHSSLSYLHELPIDSLKLDRLFVLRLDTPGRGVEILSRIIEMGKELDLQVIAEGVETPEQHAKLIEIGCTEAQGFLMCRPFLPEDLEAAGSLSALIKYPSEN